MAQEFEDITSLVKRATSLFQERFKSEPTVAVCSPGRVNLIGELDLRLNKSKYRS